MYTIRKAREADRGAIDSILQEMDLLHGSVLIDDFWVGEEGGDIVAVAQLEILGGAGMISSVGVRPSHRRRGFASELVLRMLEGVEGDAYLFTLIPEFFGRMGFEGVAPPEAVSGYRSNFNCAGCEPERCICMVRRPHVS